MGKVLVIAEKPDAAKNYLEVLKREGAFQKKPGYFESDRYIVSYEYGHLLNSRMPRDYKEFKGWTWEAIPFYPPKGKLEYFLPNDPSLQYRKDQLGVLEGLFKRKDIDYLVNGCDAGREGELIFWEVYEYFKSKHRVKRLWISSLTEEAVEEGFKNLREEAFFLPRKEASFARQYADWFLGNNLTIGFTVKAGGDRTLHVGRVKTPTLSILVKRREEIEQFVPKDYFTLEAVFGGKYKGLWFKEQLGNVRFDQKADAESVLKKITGHQGTVIKKDVVKETVKPKSLFNLNDLQREANKKYGYSPKKVLDLAQVLYEKYKILSYPRSDSRHLGKADVSGLEATIKALDIPPYEGYVKEILSKGIKTNKDFVDDAKVSDHHAIIPTKKKADLARITDESSKDGGGHTKDELTNIYNLVARRFLSVFYPPAVYEKTEVVTEVSGETFKTSGKILVSAGWEEVYGKEVDDSNEGDEEKNGLLPPINKGEVLPVTETKLNEKKTQPPKHYTEGDLLAVMEKPKKLLDSKELQDAMTETKAGLGTPATRAAIIEDLIRKRYVEKKGKHLIATEDGVNLVKVAPEKLKSPEITADWEMKLQRIQEGKLKRAEFEKSLGEFVIESLDTLKKAVLDVTFKSTKTPVGVCPNCQKAIFEFPKGFACESSTRENVCLRVWKSKSGKTLTLTHLKQLLTKGETQLIKGFKSKAGKKFDAALKWNEAKSDAVFAFDQQEKKPTAERKDMGILCPSCGSKVMESEKAFGCENFKSCKFTIWKVMAGRNMTEETVRELALSKRTAEKLNGFVSTKTKKTFNAYLQVDEKDGHVSFSFN